MSYRVFVTATAKANLRSYSVFREGSAAGTTIVS